jgi:uncharacterized membrane protein YphA (DoxX/SURF4 family)
MNERTIRDRLHAMGPFVLRLSLAAILIQDGLVRGASLIDTAAPAVTDVAEASPPTAVSATGLQFHATWPALLGIGEVAVGALLALGLLTRVVVLPVLCGLAFVMVGGLEHPAAPTNAPAMMLLAAGCLSLMCSGPGCLALGRRRKIVTGVVVEPPKAPKPPPHERFVRPGKSMVRRCRDGWAQWKSKRRWNREPRRRGGWKWFWRTRRA